MFKLNVGSYRCTDPAKLPRGCTLSHEENLPTIRRITKEAGLVLVATGNLPDALVSLGRTVFNAMRTDGVHMVCLGVTKSHWPKHTSRLAYDTPMVPFVW